MRDLVRRLIERLMPWYDRAEVAQTAARVEDVRRRSIASRVHSEQVIASYQAADRASARRR